MRSSSVGSPASSPVAMSPARGRPAEEPAGRAAPRRTAWLRPPRAWHPDAMRISAQKVRRPSADRPPHAAERHGGKRSGPIAGPDHNGNRHGGLDPHVVQVFPVHRRNIAQRAAAHVERRPADVGDLGRLEWRGNVIGIGDEAQPIAPVKLARLNWYIGCRVAQAEKASASSALSSATTSPLPSC